MTDAGGTGLELDCGTGRPLLPRPEAEALFTGAGFVDVASHGSDGSDTSDTSWITVGRRPAR